MRTLSEAMKHAGLRIDNSNVHAGLGQKLHKIDNRVANLGVTPEIALAAAILGVTPDSLVEAVISNV